MEATAYRWEDVNEDNPIPLLTRRIVCGERMMAARVRLAKGCHVVPHQHESEQIAILLSGHVRWSINPEGSPEHRYVEQCGGEVMVLPSMVVHGIDIIEDAEIMDILTPIGPMGVDKQGH